MKGRRIWQFVWIPCIVILLALGSFNIKVNAIGEDENPLPSVQVTNENVSQSDSSKISGNFDVKNLSNFYAGDLVYVTEVYKGKSFSSWELINKSFNPIELAPYETRTVKFTHILPANISTDFYHIIIRVLNRTGIAVGLKVFDIGEISGSNYFLSSNSDDAKIVKDGKEYSPLEGVNFKPGASPLANILFRNVSSEVISAYPKIVVYARDYHNGDRPVEIAKGEIVEFNPNQPRKIEFSLPDNNIPESYLAVVVMIDKNGVQVSGTREFRYVIEGISAKILSVNAFYDKAASQINAEVSVVGPAADKYILNDAKIEVNVLDNKNDELIKTETATVKLEEGIEVITLLLNLSKVAPPDLKIVATVKNGTELLDQNTVVIPGDYLTPDAVEKPYVFPDVKDTTYEYAVSKLFEAGLISGYDDGMFKPEKKITRAEFTKMIVGMLGYSIGKTEETNSAFNDVSSKHWAIGYINIAASNKLIEGYGNGEFKPDAMITYEEAVTIFIRTLGMREETDLKGAWPQNYIRQADKIGLTSQTIIENYSDSATRGNVAKLTWETYRMKDKLLKPVNLVSNRQIL